MQKRMVAFFVAIVMGFGALACRYASLCGGAEQSRYAGAFGSREISVEIQSARGSILDRNGEFLCGGEPVLAALVDPLSLSEESADALRRAALDQSAVEEAIRVGRPFLAYVSQEVRGEGLWALTAHRRYSSLAQNLIGYVDADGRGVCGLEAAADSYLYADGSSYCVSIPVDAARRTLPGFGLTFEGSPLAPLYGVQISLDREIQALCESLEGIERGAVAVMDVQTGELVALLSRPTYDPSDLAAALQSEDALLCKPLESYSCGSAFKIVVAAAALEMGLDGADIPPCSGGYAAGNLTIGCGKSEGHGAQTMEQAFAHSCNAYFCALGERVGGAALLAMAKKLGFGESLDLGLGVECRAGALPSEEDLSAPAALANFSIGQGDLQVTPLQLLRLSALIANGGVDRPMLLWEKAIEKDGSGKSLCAAGEEQRLLSEKTAAQIGAMMRLSTLEGTGVPAAPIFRDAAVKTSSAETGIVENGANVLHTWCVGFYPAQKPQFAAVVLVEGGRSGYYSAAPVFGALCDALAGTGKIR